MPDTQVGRIADRAMDLVRYARGHLLDAGLISADEYGELVMNPGPGSVARLQSYDSLRARITELEAREREIAAALWPHKQDGDTWSPAFFVQAIEQLRAEKLELLKALRFTAPQRDTDSEDIVCGLCCRSLDRDLRGHADECIVKPAEKLAQEQGE